MLVSHDKKIDKIILNERTDPENLKKNTIMKIHIKITCMALLFTFLFSSCGPSDKELRTRVKTILISNIVLEDVQRNGSYPTSLKAAISRTNMTYYPELKNVKISEVLTYDGTGGWVYSPKNKILQVNLDEFKNIKIDLSENCDKYLLPEKKTM